jgi:hypothetical protein
MTIHNQQKLGFHNSCMVELFPILSQRGVSYRVPNEYEEAGHDHDNDDHGFDFSINGHIIDFKSFGLRLINGSATWDSTYWDCRKDPRRPGLVNEFYMFRTEPDPKKWMAMRRSDLKISKHGYAPYCWREKLLTIDQLILQCDS